MPPVFYATAYEAIVVKKFVSVPKYPESFLMGELGDSQ